MASKENEANIKKLNELSAKNILHRLADNREDVEDYEVEFLMDYLKGLNREDLVEDIGLVYENYLQEREKVIFDDFKFFRDLIGC